MYSHNNSFLKINKKKPFFCLKKKKWRHILSNYSNYSKQGSWYFKIRLVWTIGNLGCIKADFQAKLNIIHPQNKNSVTPLRARNFRKNLNFEYESHQINFSLNRLLVEKYNFDTLRYRYDPFGDSLRCSI